MVEACVGGLPVLCPTPGALEKGQVPTFTHFHPELFTNYTWHPLGIKAE
jgi:hypothetical protein